MKLAYRKKEKYLKEMERKGITGSEALERWNAYNQKYDRFLELDALITERILDFLEEEFEYNEEDGEVYVEKSRYGSRIILFKDASLSEEIVITPINLTIYKPLEYRFEEKSGVTFSGKVEPFTLDYDFESFFNALKSMLSDDYPYRGVPWYDVPSPHSKPERFSLNSQSNPRRRKNPVGSGTLFALGLGYLLGKK